MSLHVPTLEARELVGCDEDARQLTAPWRRRTVVVRAAGWDHNRNRIYRDEVVLHDEAPLLEQLRRVAVGGLPQHASAKTRRRPGKRKPAETPLAPPGWNHDASHRLAEIYVEVAGWWSRLGGRAIGYDEDWYAVAIKVLAGRAGALDAYEARELVDAVRRWWTWCVVQVGHSVDDLLQQRRTR